MVLKVGKVPFGKLRSVSGVSSCSFSVNRDEVSV